MGHCLRLHEQCPSQWHQVGGGGRGTTMGSQTHTHTCRATTALLAHCLCEQVPHNGIRWGGGGREESHYGSLLTLT